MTKRLSILLLALSLAACATDDRFREARSLMESEQTEEGLARMERLVAENPGDSELRNYYQRHRAVAVQRYLQAGDNARGAGQLDRAEAAYRSALRFDPENARARAALQALERQRGTAAQLAEADAALQRGEPKEALEKARQVLAADPAQREARAIVRKVEEERLRAESAPPQLAAALKNTITIELRDAPVKSVFEMIAKRSGLNFVYDKDLPAGLRTSVFVRDTTIEEVIKTVLMTNQLEKRVLNPATLLIYPNTADKAQAYKELTVKSFYLANADVKQTANMVRQLVKTRDLYVDEKLNLLVIRDTPEAVRVAEKLIASQDLGDAEVMLEVEVLEVGHSLLEDLGVQWPGSASLGLIGAAGVPGQITAREAQDLNGNNVRIRVSDPLLAVNLRQQAGRTNVLANPRIRVKSREKARIHIGERVPVITTTAGATGFVSESVNYLDVGLKLEVEPQVSLENDVSIKMGLEVSNISAETRTASGTLAYQVGTRNAATTLRLHDGETQVLAGLISDEDRRAASQVPGLSRLPLIGRLFRNDNDSANRTEIVLLITPRVLRSIERPAARIEEFNSGTELEVGRAGAAPAVAPMIVAPATPDAPPPPGSPAPPAAGPLVPPAAGPLERK
ncbi:MAG: secretin N-terminal domain-containing protein [Betaproteobacteria bacterium]